MEGVGGWAQYDSPVSRCKLGAARSTTCIPCRTCRTIANREYSVTPPDGPSIFSVSLPDWVGAAVPWDDRFPTDEARMDLAIALSRENVDRGTGGPFGACVFEQESGRLVAAGVNSVQRHNNSVLHAEMVALMMAQHRLQRFTLHDEGLPLHDLVTSCDPCAMCFGAVLWSGVRRVVSGATRDDAANLGFDEGPVFDESYQYLEARGIKFHRKVRRQAAVEVLERYRRAGGAIYNG